MTRAQARTPSQIEVREEMVSDKEFRWARPPILLKSQCSQSPEWRDFQIHDLGLGQHNATAFRSDTQIFAPFFNPPQSVTQNGLTTLTMNTNYEDFLAPIFTSFAGAAFPLRLYGTNQGGIGGEVPEPSMLLVLASGLAGVIWWRRRRAVGSL